MCCISQWNRVPDLGVSSCCVCHVDYCSSVVVGDVVPLLTRVACRVVMDLRRPDVVVVVFRSVSLSLRIYERVHLEGCSKNVHVGEFEYV